MDAIEQAIEKLISKKGSGKDIVILTVKEIGSKAFKDFSKDLDRFIPIITEWFQNQKHRRFITSSDAWRMVYLDDPHIEGPYIGLDTDTRFNAVRFTKLTSYWFAVEVQNAIIEILEGYCPNEGMIIHKKPKDNEHIFIVYLPSDCYPLVVDQIREVANVYKVEIKFEFTEEN